jgi:hypothetical protein
MSHTQCNEHAIVKTDLHQEFWSHSHYTPDNTADTQLSTVICKYSIAGPQNLKSNPYPWTAWRRETILYHIINVKCLHSSKTETHFALPTNFGYCCNNRTETLWMVSLVAFLTQHDLGILFRLPAHLTHTTVRALPTSTDTYVTTYSHTELPFNHINKTNTAKVFLSCK